MVVLIDPRHGYVETMIGKIAGQGGRCERNELDGHTQIVSQPVGIGDVEANQLSCCILIAERNDMWIEAYAQHTPLADVGDRGNAAIRVPPRNRVLSRP